MAAPHTPHSSSRRQAAARLLPPALAAASSWSAAYRECAFDRLLNFVGFLLHSATQVMSLLAWSTLPGSERFQRVLSCVVAGGMWLLPSLAPRFYLRWRKESLTVYRLVFFAFPLLRKARGAHANAGRSGPPRRSRSATQPLGRAIWPHK